MRKIVRAIFDSLIFKISLLILALILLVVGVMTYAALNREQEFLVTLTDRTVDLQKQTYKAGMRDRGRTLAKLMKAAGEDAVISLDYGTLNSLAENAVLDPEVSYVFFLDDQNQVMAATGEYPFLEASPGLAQPLADTVSQAVKQNLSELDGEQVLDRRYSHGQESEFLEVATPIKVEGELRALIRIGFTLEEMKSAISSIESSNTEFTREKLRETFQANLLIAGVSLLVGLLASIFLARRISKPMVEMMSKMRRAESGDLTTRVDVNSRDEIARLSQSFNNMLENLADVVGEILESSRQLRNSASSLATVVSQNQASIETVSENMETIDEGARENAGLVDDSTELVKSLAEDSNEIAEDNRKVMEMSEDMREGAGEGHSAVKKVIDNIGDIETRVTRTRAALDKLNRAAADIDQITDSIEFITRKTNLLAYNVSISAAESGGERAEEISTIVRQVQKLANESSDAASQIKQKVAAIREAGTEVAERMSATEHQTEEGVELARRAGGSLEEIVDSVNRVYDHFVRVTEQAEKQAKKTERIDRAMTKISHISNQTKNRTQDISEAVENQTDGIEDVSRAAENLRQQADSLRELMEDFEV